MRLFVTSDANEESGAGHIVSDLSGPTGDHFKSRNYGNGLAGVVVVLMCRDASLKFHRRLRFSRKDNIIYMDIMLDYAEMVAAKRAKRRAIVIARLGREIPEVLQKYKIAGFDRERFVADLRTWLVKAAKLPYLKIPTTEIPAEWTQRKYHGDM